VRSTAGVAERAALEAAWELSDRIFGLVAAEGMLRRPISLRQPFLFYLGHLPAFAWNHLWRGALARATFDEPKDALFERGIDPPDDADRVTDAGETWPAIDEVLAYRDRVRRQLREALEEPRLASVLPMVIEHELMHHETLLYMVQQLPAGLRARAAAPVRITGTRAPGGRIPIPPGVARLGARRDGVFRWDNEHPELLVEVPAFAIDCFPVTNGEFRDFVEAGGYRDRRLWSDDAWNWRERNGILAPPFWRDGWRRVATLLEDVPCEIAADWPVHVSQCEASAYARWTDARLPSEAEFHRAAFGTPTSDVREHPWGDDAPRTEHGNLGLRYWEPCRVDAHPAGASAWGVHDLVGNGWEWTRSVFAPFRGFEPLPRYPGYSTDFFDGRHFVMLGASWATAPRLVRRSFRNWFQPHYPYVFAKFRCVRARA